MPKPKLACFFLGVFASRLPTGEHVVGEGSRLAFDVYTISIYTSDMKFVWDEAKRDENIANHGIDFSDIPAVFDGPMLVRLDTRHDYGEDRWIGMGLLRTMVVVVVYVEWEDEETIRIISARRATRHESTDFYERLAN